MSKAEKIDALLESAILSFGKDGYVGASLRDIAARAGISLGTIHMYYGSKVELYQAAHRHIWIEISGERDVLLREALRVAPGQTPELANVVRALALPIVRRALSKAERDVAQLFV